MNTQDPKARPGPPPKTPWYGVLYLQVLMAVAIGIAIGYLAPEHGKDLKPLGDAFINLVKMIIGPIIFCTVVHGIASMADLRRLGRIGIKTLVYFEIVSTVALVIGLCVVNILKPGVGFNIDPKTLDPKLAATYVQQAHSLNVVDFLLHIIPTTFFGAFVGDNLLQVLLIAVLSGFALLAMRERGLPILAAIHAASEFFFSIIRLVVRVAPIGALGAMAFTVGSYGLGALSKLAALMAGFYLTAALFVVIVLGSIALGSGFSIFHFLAYIREELLLVLGTSSSETALPGIMQKLRRLGCSESTVGLVIPTGYSFNLDGTNIYMSMAAIFLAQATNIPLNLHQQIELLGVAMLSSKGASGVSGAGFITLAATLAVVPGIPIESLALLVGIDRFMSECRSLTNLIGNGVATIVISRSEGEVSEEQLRKALSLGPSPEGDVASQPAI